jgi:GMP synthase (glutamine-hydrolysing)
MPAAPADPAGPRVLIVQNTARGHPDRLADWLAQDGTRPEIVHAYAGDVLPPSLAGHGALVVLGGPAMPDDDDAMPWLAAVRALAREAVASRVPYLGVCLGGQLLAHVTGGSVRARHGAPELGSTRLTLTPQAARDPLLHGLPDTVTAVERHVDRIVALPAGAVWLARSDLCPYQAFRYGELAWGTQFHPEVSAARLRQWDAASLRREGFDPDELVRVAERDEPAAVPVWREVTRRFARLARSPAGSSVESPAGSPADSPASPERERERHGHGEHGSGRTGTGSARAAVPPGGSQP